MTAYPIRGLLPADSEPFPSYTKVYTTSNKLIWRCAVTVQPVPRWRFRCCHDAMPGRYPSSCKFLHSLCRKEDLPADIAFAPSRARHRSQIEPAVATAAASSEACRVPRSPPAIAAPAKRRPERLGVVLAGELPHGGLSKLRRGWGHAIGLSKAPMHDRLECR
jgi:hypothetical protein